MSHQMSEWGDESVASRRRTLRGEKGQGLVEFAMITPLLLILIAGIVGFGIGLNYYLDLTHTANQGARYAAVNLASVCSGAQASTPCPNVTPSTKTFETFLRQELTSGNLQNGGTSSLPNPAVVKACFIDEPNNGTKNGIADIGEPVTVSISTDYRFLPFVGLNVKLVGKATMRMEQTPTLLKGQGGSWAPCT